MNYSNKHERIKATSDWKSRFRFSELLEIGERSIAILKMPYGVARRKEIMSLLSTGYRICLNWSGGGGWNIKDKDLKYLLKKGKVKRFKQYEDSAISDHKSHTYIGVDL